MPARSQMPAEPSPEEVGARGVNGGGLRCKLDGSRVRIRESDVCHLIRSRPVNIDAILLDVDNGPEGLTSKAMTRMY